MDYNAAFQISATGLAVEKMRMDVTAANLANVHSSASSTGQLYRPMRVVSQEAPLEFSRQFGELYVVTGGGAQIVSVEPMAVAPRLVNEPGHPHADSKGFVSYPGINLTAEMVNLMGALRAYEANVVAMNAAKTMAARAMEIGGQS